MRSGYAGKVKGFINKYPTWSYSILTGVIIYFFLKIFKPLGLQQIPEKLSEPLFFGYAIIGFLLVMINHLFFGKILETKWPSRDSLIRKYIWPIWITIPIIIANVYFTRWYFIRHNLTTLKHFQIKPVIVGTLALGFLCILIIEMIDQNIQLKLNLKIQQDLNEKLKLGLKMEYASLPNEQTISLIAQNGKEKFQYQLQEILFITAQENYVEIFSKKNKKGEELIRCTLSSVEEQLKDCFPPLFRCHRSHIVNLKNVKSVSGNAKGFRLFFSSEITPIPVSRSYVPQFRDIVKSFF